MLCLLINKTERMMVLHYQITIKEYLEDSWSTWFDGLIDKARDLGLTLVAVGPSAPPGLADEPQA